ncbi:cation/H(+) antiporter 15-like [Tasmannia lanceolata]|uniref:cation/H(+) antiporter 15-like n=1 Tax=Tasmannia lanceolata TaxID=3420 RepID=UPI004063CFC3
MANSVSSTDGTPRHIIGNSQVVCYSSTMITTDGIWDGDDPLQYSLPLFILQLTLIVVTTRILVFILKPLRQPRVIAEILGGILLGPSCLGRVSKGWLASKLFPIRSVTILETMANVGLLYFLFLVGVEMDITMVRRTGRRAVIVALAGMILPFIIGTSASFLLKNVITKNVPQGPFLLFLGVALSVTAFPVLARILAELKLLNTELGKISMSAAIINDICAWILLALSIALTQKEGFILASLWVVLSGAAFVLFCFFVVRPSIWWILQKTPEGETVDELYICMILTGVMASGFITDAIGIHSIFGAFVFGLVIPNGLLGLSLMEKLEDFVSGLLLPLFFAISGLKTDLFALKDFSTWGFLLLTVLLACTGKVVGTMMIAHFYCMPFREGLSLGMLMNTKGLIEMIVLNVGRDQQILDEESFALLVFTSLLMTAIITPVVTAVYRPARRFIPYKRRTIQRSKLDSELRILACIHSPRNVPTLINLIEASHPTKKSPIFLYVLHLVELTGRASAMLIVHNTQKPDRHTLNRAEVQSDHIVNAFEQYQKKAVGVYVQPLTAISPYSSMHEDICTLAEERRASLIIVPFHKEQTVDGALEATNPAFRSVNQNLLANAQCSVAILIDRGLGGTTRVATSHVLHHVVVLFFGGPDDREALSYAWRMTEHDRVSLTVLRFLEGDLVVETVTEITMVTNSEQEKQMDDELVNEFRLKNVSDESVVYVEKVVNNGEETVTEIRGLGSINDLYIVGRGEGILSSLTAGMMEWSECPELGPIGDLLASSDFACTASVLVVQQYAGAGPNDGVGTPDSPGNEIDQYLQNPRRTGDTPSGSQRRQGPSGYGNIV